MTHGLTATTVIDVLEDDAEFRSFKDQIVSAYQPVSTIHQELVRRLVSVLWRLRRAHAVETGLLSIQSKLQRDVRVPASQIDMLELFGLEDDVIRTPIQSSHRNDNEPKPQPGHSCGFAITTAKHSIA